jgi:hypothetical protein
MSVVGYYRYKGEMADDQSPPRYDMTVLMQKIGSNAHGQSQAG